MTGLGMSDEAKPPEDEPCAVRSEPAISRASLIDVLDHILDKGVVIEAAVRVPGGGIEGINAEPGHSTAPSESSPRIIDGAGKAGARTRTS